MTGYVNDYGGMISPPIKSQIESELNAFEKTDSTQVVVLTIPSLDGAVLEEFAIKAGEAWKIGQKGKDNGVIIVVSKADKKIRIEVGRGLEGKLTDLMAGRIIDLVIKPRFKRGDYDGGFHAGIAAIIDATRGEFKAEPSSRRQQKRGSSSLVTFLIFAAVAIVVLGSISRPLGAVGGAVGLPLSILLSSISVGVMWLAILGVVGLILGLVLPMLFGGGKGGGGGFFPGGGYYGGGGFSSGGSSGGSDFGGGGGGDFGGGGASGDW
ncbi:MAG: TPM domain-containing protein [Thermodesulfovibrionales bacterium]